MDVMQVLNQVEQGTLSAAEGVKALADLQNTASCADPLPEPEEGKRAKWLKIKIVDPESSFRLSLPPLPLGLTGKLAAFLIKLTARYAADSDTAPLDSDDLRLLLEALKILPPVQLVSVSDDRGTVVEIYTK